MTTLVFAKKCMRAAQQPRCSTLPNIASVDGAPFDTRSRLDEDDGLYIGYGFVKGSYPYSMQDDYDRALSEREFDTAVLENEYLRAEFIPSLGGRLWSLFDKVKGRELLFSNPVLRFGNLAVRNAWFSGGVEFNCGFVGHHPHTAEPTFTARLKLGDGTPVLRMYAFERLRRAEYQMDFFLPEGSRLLYARMRIVNPNEHVIPMYWWSNIAVPESRSSRVVVDAESAYTHTPQGMIKTPVPMYGDADITYPVNNPRAIDFFWNIPEAKRKFVCQADGEGYGLVQASTARLRGRKLFVWGQGPGADKWQEYLSDGVKGGGRYVEIQAGIAHTQSESLPMPPKSAWEWLEAYGALEADPARVHGAWEEARGEVSRALEALVSEKSMEDLLTETRDMARSAAEELISCGPSFGALERELRQAEGEPPLSAHLDFGAVGSEQADLAALLREGFLAHRDPLDTPAAYPAGAEWERRLKKAAAGADRYNWYTHYLLGALLFARGAFGEAQEAFTRSADTEVSCWALYGLSQCERVKGNDEEAAMLLLRASLTKSDDYSLAKAAMDALLRARRYRAMLDLYEKLPASVAKRGRILLSLAYARLRCGDVKGAEELLLRDGGLDVADVREGENSVTELWFEIEEAKAEREGREFSRQTAEPPAWLDFRMDAVKKKD